MKMNIRKITRVEFTVDGSEAIMFNKGGRIDFSFKKSFFLDDDDEKVDEYADLAEAIKSSDEVIFSVQIKPSDRNYFDFVRSSAEQHLNNLTEEDKAAREREKHLNDNVKFV